MNTITIEKLEEVLLSTGFTMSRLKRKSDEQLIRNFLIFIDGFKYTIEWWCNACYLKSDYNGSVAVFHDVKYTNTWQGGLKMNLQFYDANGNVCFILPGERG